MTTVSYCIELKRHKIAQNIAWKTRGKALHVPKMKRQAVGNNTTQLHNIVTTIL